MPNVSNDRSAVPANVTELRELLSYATTPHDDTYDYLVSVIGQKSFSIAQLQEYQTDVWDWIMRSLRAHCDDKDKRK